MLQSTTGATRPRCRRADRRLSAGADGRAPRAARADEPVVVDARAEGGAKRVSHAERRAKRSAEWRTDVNGVETFALLAAPTLRSPRALDATRCAHCARTRSSRSPGTRASGGGAAAAVDLLTPPPPPPPPPPPLTPLSQGGAASPRSSHVRLRFRAAFGRLSERQSAIRRYSDDTSAQWLAPMAGDTAIDPSAGGDANDA